MKKLKLLYVEDEDVVRKNHIRYLEDQFDIKIYEASDGVEAYNMYLEYKPDILFTDITMPYMSGLELIEKIRKIDKEIKIAVISAHSEQEKLLKAIELNLITYQIKPINRLKLNELMNKSIISLLEENVNDLLHHFTKGNYFNRRNFILTENKQEVHLTVSEGNLLSFLIEKKNIIVSSEEIFNHLWTCDKQFSQSAIRTLIKKIRKKISTECIENIYGGKYRLIDTHSS